MECPSAGNHCHAGQVDCILDWSDLEKCKRMFHGEGVRKRRETTYYKIRDENLQDLRSQARSVAEQPLQDANQGVAQWRTDQGSICHHFGHTAAEVVTMFAAIMCKP